MQGNSVVEYTYDPYGYILATTGSMAGTLGKVNPLRYRGYMYDEEIGLYYLRSRYYDPQWGRFLNADTFLGPQGKLLGHNVFSYCRQNPACKVDANGHSELDVPKEIFGEPISEEDYWRLRKGKYKHIIDPVLGFPSDTLHFFTENSSLPIHDSMGRLIRYRIFDSNGRAVKDIDLTNHGNPKQHPNVPHAHDWGGGNGRDQSGRELTPEDKDDLEGAKRENGGANPYTPVAEAVGVLVGFYIVRWIVAAILAPTTGGASLVLAL